MVTVNVRTGKVAQYTMPTPASVPEGVVTEPDGAIWVTEDAGQNVARIDPATGHIQEFSL